MRHRILLMAIVVALAGLTFAATASATTIRGKVVHKNRSAHSYVVAKRSGQMVTVHARRSPALGRKVVVNARLLSNGTYGQRAVQLGSLTHRARVHGVVTFVNARGTKAVISAKGVSLVVHKSATARAAAPLAVGDVVTVTGEFDDEGDIDVDTVEHDGTDDGYFELEGHVLAVDTTARTVTLTADDEGELAGSITVVIPDGWDMSGYAVGDEIEVTATLNADGTFTAVGTSHDGDQQEADDDSDQQGEDYDDVEGDVVSIDLQTRTLTVAVDEDDAMAGATVKVIIPAEMDISVYSVGDELEIVAVQNADGTYTAVSTQADDEQDEGEQD